ncbi:hypothetical protein LSP04_16510 [Levilactobacillus spicheri]|uniref:Uncharacterized protein n=1 Tax=Levilactobacillus spicheri TaxID=216463 RepID=A0ABQ0WQ79_9LACO|nr:hypothetical protein LSP04_16510 [Levilactobacillus spicheri]
MMPNTITISDILATRTKGALINAATGLAIEKIVSTDPTIKPIFLELAEIWIIEK